MKTRIRFITRTAAGGTEYIDRMIDADVITIGRATDRTLHLKDRHARLQHAEIRKQDGEVRITTHALTSVVVNGRSQREARLSPGDVIEVGANVLRVMDPAADVDFAISFELSEDARSEDLAADWSEQQAGVAGLSMRRISWYLVGAVAFFSLLLPGLGLLHPGIASFARNSPLVPDDALWLAGPLHSAHAAISSSCESCHQAVFTRVEDAACTACHDANRHVAAGEHAVLGETRCASCHLEHNEPPELVNRHQGLCADCHADVSAATTLQGASDFQDDHPEFHVSLLLPVDGPDGGTDWVVQREPLDTARGADRSNLKFPHNVHVDRDGVVAPDGRRVLECSNCHQPEPGGAGMQAVNMEDHCSDCHRLEFDAAEPTRQVPHGDAAAVVQSLIEYYSARLLGSDPADTEQRLRRPGQRLSREDRDRVASQARAQALEVASDLFERRACINCHDVQKVESAEIPWRVAPVRLTPTFFINANFSHAAHDTEVTSCDGCHAASASGQAADLLIPGIDNCRECHGSGIAWRNDRGQTPSTCIMCHSFHLAGKGQYP